MAVTVGAVTIMIHDRTQSLREAYEFVLALMAGGDSGVAAKRTSGLR